VARVHDHGCLFPFQSEKSCSRRSASSPTFSTVLVSAGRDPDATPVAEVMSAPLITVENVGPNRFRLATTVETGDGEAVVLADEVTEDV